MKKKTKIVLLLFSLFLIIPNVNALDDLSGLISVYYHYHRGQNDPISTSFTKLATSDTNNVSIGSFETLNALTITFGGGNYSSGDNVFFKIIFTIWHDSNDKNKPKGDMVNLMQFASFASMHPVVGTAVKWNIDFPTSGASAVLHNYSNYSEVVISFSVPVTSNCNGLRISWGDTASPWYVLENHTLYPMKVGVTRIQSQVVKDSNNVVIDQNNTIITQGTETNEKLENINNSTNKLNDSLNDDKTDEATSKAGEFFSGFETNTFGLTSIITAPLNLIGSITSSTCSPLGLKIPFMSTNKTLNLPCLSSIYQQYFGSFLTIYQTITFGIVAYWVCVRIFALVKDFKNPDHDEIEVLDL